MATRLSLRRVGDSTGKLIAAPDSVAELLEKATKKLKLPSDAKANAQQRRRRRAGFGHRGSSGGGWDDHRPDECAESPTNRPTL